MEDIKVGNWITRKGSSQKYSIEAIEGDRVKLGYYSGGLRPKDPVRFDTFFTRMSQLNVAEVILKLS